jgi:NMD protein affecting ribosome stability and mRNA decay
MEFCPGCGKKSKGICKECRPHKEIEAKKILIRICVECQKYFHKNKWHKYKEVEKAVEKVTRESVKERLTKVTPILKDVPVKPGVQREIGVEIVVKDDVSVIPANIEITYCNNCSKKQGDYFEGVFQLRNIDENIFEFVKKYCKNHSIFIIKEEKAKNGYDLKISDKKKAHHLAVSLQKSFGGILKINPQVFSQDRQTSKIIYRVNFYYEAPDYKIGDVVKIDNKVIHIHKISKTLTGTDLKTGKSTNVDSKKDYSILIKEKTTVSKVNPQIEILDPETYQSVKTENKADVKLGEKVTIVNDNGLFYILHK